MSSSRRSATRHRRRDHGARRPRRRIGLAYSCSSARRATAGGRPGQAVARLERRGAAPSARCRPARPRASTGGDLAGTWTIDPSIGSFADFSSSFVGYRVDETLADNDANTAVGRTPDVSGTLVLDGTSITVGRGHREPDGPQERRRSARRPAAPPGDRDGRASRRPRSASRARSSSAPAPVDGETISATATGELTLHGVTKTVEVPIEARLSGDVVTVTGSIDIVFADYAIDQPDVVPRPVDRGPRDHGAPAPLPPGLAAP